MNKNGTVMVDGITYYHEMLWKALVQQNLEMGMQQNVDRGRMNTVHGELQAAKGKLTELQDELDFALQRLDDAVRGIVDFQQRQTRI